MRRTAFTLVELLVVVAIIAVLVGLLIPSLGRARAQAKLSACGSNLRQIGLGIVNYANMYQGAIPRGLAKTNPFRVPESHFATSQLWYGQGPFTPPDLAVTYTGVGLLLKIKTAVPGVFYCPADESSDEEDELPKIGTDENAYCSYVYRQLDMIPRTARKGLLGNLGVNRLQTANGRELPVAVEALALDVSSYGEGEFLHITHEGTTANILYQDTSVQLHANKDRMFSLSEAHFAPLFTAGDPVPLLTRLNDILIRADFSRHADPAQSPPGPTEVLP